MKIQPRSKIVDAFIEVAQQLTPSQLKELDKNPKFNETLDLLRLRAKQHEMLQRLKQLKQM